MALENHTLLNVQVNVNVTEVQYAKSSLTNIIYIHITANLQGTVLLIHFWCKIKESTQLPEKTIGIFLS